MGELVRGTEQNPEFPMSEADGMRTGTRILSHNYG